MGDKELVEILRDNRNIAVVGLSRDEKKPAHVVPKFLQERGYRIIPVNPFADELLGERAYPSLREVEEEVDIVEIFRPGEEAYEIVEEALDIGADVVWMQEGIRNDEAVELARAKGLEVVQDCCMMKEYQRLIGDNG